MQTCVLASLACKHTCLQHRAHTHHMFVHLCSANTEHILTLKRSQCSNEHSEMTVTPQYSHSQPIFLNTLNTDILIHTFVQPRICFTVVMPFAANLPAVAAPTPGSSWAVKASKKLSISSPWNVETYEMKSPLIRANHP